MCCLIVGIQASGESILLFLLMLLGWSLIWIASLTLRVYQWGSRSINLVLIQIGICPVSLACSGIAEVWVRANRMSLSCFFILFHIDLPVSLIFLFYSCLFVCWWTLAAFAWDLVNDTHCCWLFNEIRLSGQGTEDQSRLFYALKLSLWKAILVLSNSFLFW